MQRSIGLLALLGLLFVNAAAAQTCVGSPADEGQVAAAVAFTTVDGGDRWGFEGGWNLASDLSLFGRVGVTDPDAAGGNATYVGVGTALFAGRITEALGQTFTACTTASITFADVGDTDVYRVPIGFGAGTSLALGEGDEELQPWIVPSLVLSHAEGDTASEFQVSVGANALFGSGFYLGGSVNRVFGEGSGSEYALHAGLAF